MSLSAQFTKEPALKIEAQKFYSGGIQAFIEDAMAQVDEAVKGGQMSADDFALCKFNDATFPIKPGESLAQIIDTWSQEVFKNAGEGDMSKLPEVLNMFKEDLVQGMAKGDIPPQHAVNLAKMIVNMEEASEEKRFGEEYKREYAHVVARLTHAKVFYPKEAAQTHQPHAKA